MSRQRLIIGRRRTEDGGQRREDGRRIWLLASVAVALSVFCLPSSVFAFGKDNAGTSGAAFLKIAPGARPVGMGEAFTGVADDLHAIHWNPAGLSKLTVPEVSGMHMSYVQNMAFEYAGFAYPTERLGTFGVAITHLHTDNIERRLEDTDSAVGEFDATDTAYWLSYARRLNDRFSLGSNFKYIRQQLDDQHAGAYAFDAGGLYETGWHDVRLGASVLNLGTKVKFINEADPLPLTFRAGASAPVLTKHLLLALDLIAPRDQAIGAAFGGEYTKAVTERMAWHLRSGYRTNTDVDGLSGISVGTGLTLGRGRLDFAWVPFGDLGNAYRFALHVKLGEPGEPVVPRLQKSSAVRPSDPIRDPSLETLLSL